MKDNTKTQLISPSLYANKKQPNLKKEKVSFNNFYLFLVFFLFMITLTSIVLFLKLYISQLKTSIWWFKQYPSFEVISFFNRTFHLGIDESESNLKFWYWLLFGSFLFMTIFLSILQLLLVRKTISTIGLSLISSFFLICAIDFFKGEGINTIFKIHEHFFNPELLFFIIGLFLLFFNFALNSKSWWFKQINILLVVIYLLVVWKFIFHIIEGRDWTTHNDKEKANEDNKVFNDRIFGPYIELIIIALALCFGSKITLLGVLIFYAVSIWVRSDVFIPDVELFDTKDFTKDITMYSLKYVLPAIGCSFIRFSKNKELSYRSLIIKLVLISYFYIICHLIYDFIFIYPNVKLINFIFEQIIRYGIFTFGGLLIVVGFKYLNDHKFIKVVKT